MGLIQPLILLSAVCLTCSARYVSESDAAVDKIPFSEKIPVHLSPCKRKSRAAYYLCYKQVAKTDQERLACARLYVDTMIKCYFEGVASGKDCTTQVDKMLENCVMESMGYEDVFACTNAKDARLAKCKKSTTPENKGDMLQEPNHMLFNEALHKRVSNVMCNKCYTRFSVCAVLSDLPEKYKVCVINKEGCVETYNC